MWKLDANAIMHSAPHDRPGIVKYRSIKPLIVEAVQVSGPAIVRKPDGMLHASAGDWVTLDPQGNVGVCDNAYFRDHYARLMGSKRLEEFKEQDSGGGC